ncbi:MAG: 4-diphosphocytidyl-2C-methyl-D-erythritol kinase [Spirosoma sp.]|nr:4-diphosphocytidyl-2C-methyl-D-erythritol kinase [Spirosoma sp.]
MLTFPSAKINLGLRIIEKRPDGFHSLQSCFYPVGWSDVLEVIPTSTFKFSSSGLPIPGAPETNLCIRAYKLLAADFNLPPVQLHLHKLVPIGAGLGGGSADAAFTLKLLNDRFNLTLDVASLENYARRLGSDCAFFVQNRPRYCLEKGEVFEDIALDLGGYYLLLVYPNIAISTAEAYAAIHPRRPETELCADLKSPINTWCSTILNDFENSLFPKYPVLSSIKQQLYKMGAVYASMSGSGSTLYGIFNASVNLPNQFGHYRVWQGRL